MDKKVKYGWKKLDEFFAWTTDEHPNEAWTLIDTKFGPILWQHISID